MAWPLFRKTSSGAMGLYNREIFWSQISTIVRTCRARALLLCVFLGVAQSHFSLRQRLRRQAQPAMAYRQLWQCCAKASSLSEACRRQMGRLQLLAPVDYS